MARGRHRRRSGLLSRLLPQRRRSRSALRDEELDRLRALVDTTAETAATALVRAAAAEDAALAAQARALQAEAALSSARDEVAALRADLAALCEELVWAFAARRADVVEPPAAPAVVDLREGSATSA